MVKRSAGLLPDLVTQFLCLKWPFQSNIYNKPECSVSVCYDNFILLVLHKADCAALILFVEFRHICFTCSLLHYTSSISCWKSQVWSSFVVCSTHSLAFREWCSNYWLSWSTQWENVERGTCVAVGLHLTNTFSIIHLYSLWILECNSFKTDCSTKPILRQILIFVYSLPPPFETRGETRHLTVS